jgi:hypothetical protein
MPGSLAARAFLLAYDLDRQRTTGDQLALVVRGALLVELNLRGGLTVDDDGRVKASGTVRTGDEVMDGVLRTISEARPRSWRSWVRVNARQTLCAVRRQLAAAGVVSLDVHRVLGIFPRTRVTMREPAAVIAPRQSLRAVVAGTRPASAEDAALVALVAVGQLSATLSRKDRRAHAARIGELTEQGEAAAPALRSVLRQIKAARTAAQAGG